MKKDFPGISTQKLLTATQIKETIEIEWEQLKEKLLLQFVRPETQKTVLDYLSGLISGIERKNSWQLAEQAGYKNPYAFQYLLGRAKWDANSLRDEVRNYSLEYLEEKGGVLSIDETGFLKKGTQSVGVGRQYSGTAGRIENSQIGVFLSYSSTHGRTLIDRELYIPQEWFSDKNRCEQAGIPEHLTFKKKPALAKQMLASAFDSGVKPSWVVGDSVYGCGSLRHWLESQQQAYVLAVASNQHVFRGSKQYSVSKLLENVSKHQWKQISAGTGSKGERYYEWNRLKINSDSPNGWSRWLLFRRNINNPTDVCFYIAYAANTENLKKMACAAGSRWTIEECFEMAKGEVGLDQYEIRSWIGWYRHITLALLALSFLTKLRYQLNQKELPIEEKKVRRTHTLKKFMQSRGLV